MNFFSVKRIKIDEDTNRLTLLNELSRNPLEGSLRGEVKKVDGKNIYYLRSATLYEKLLGAFGLFSKENEKAKKVVQEAVDFLKTKESYKGLTWDAVKNPQGYEDGRLQSIKFDQLFKEIKSPHGLYAGDEKRNLLKAFTDTTANLAQHSILEMNADHIVMRSSTFLEGAKTNDALKFLKHEIEFPNSASTLNFGTSIVLPVRDNNLSSYRSTYPTTCMEDRNLLNKNSVSISSGDLYKSYSNALKGLKGTVALEPFPNRYIKNKDDTEAPQYDDEHLKSMIRAVKDAAEGLDKDSWKEPSASNKLYVTIATEDHRLYERIKLLSMEVRKEASKPKQQEILKQEDESDSESDDDESVVDPAFRAWALANQSEEEDSSDDDGTGVYPR